jgi:hypothetical protein
MEVIRDGLRQLYAWLRGILGGSYYRALRALWANSENNRQIQSLLGLVMILFLVWMLSRFTLIGNSLNAEPMDVTAAAQHVRDTNPFFAPIPLRILEFFVLRLSTPTLRYAALPLLAVILVFFAGASFVRDVFDLDSFGQGLRHMVSGMFALFYPKLLVDEGEIKLENGKTNLLHNLGGPGYVLIQPGNVAQMRHLRGLTNTATNADQTYFLAHFETVELAVSLEDQVGYIPSSRFETQDGIQVVFKDIRFGYRIKPAAGFVRSVVHPYSYDPAALEHYIFDRSKDENEYRSWKRNISFAIDGPIRQLVNENKVDFLMAPKLDQKEVRRKIREYCLQQQPLSNYGAELLWIDIGGIEAEVFGEEINGQRVERWAVTWKGAAEITRAYGRATRRVFLEVARAQAQAAAITSIMDSLDTVNWQDDEVTNLRRILLSRTAQLLERLLEDDSEADCEGEEE